MLTIKNLRKRYGNFQALDGLNLEVADGELFGFVGPNGAGKTTTLKILAGLLVPDEGEVEIGGLDVYSDGKELRRRIGYVPDFFGVYGIFCILLRNYGAAGADALPYASGTGAAGR